MVWWSGVIKLSIFFADQTMQMSADFERFPLFSQMLIDVSAQLIVELMVWGPPFLLFANLRARR